MKAFTDALDGVVTALEERKYSLGYIEGIVCANISVKKKNLM